MNPVSWHRPHGIFVAAGKSIKHDELIHGSSLLDIAPTVLTLLGQAVPDDMDGKALTRILAEPMEPAHIASYEPPDPKDGIHRDIPMEESDPFAARQALQQLAELGYVELPADGEASTLVTQVERDRRNNLAQVYFAAGRTEEAIKLLRELVAESNNPDQRCQLAMQLAGLGRLSEAEEIIEPVTADTKSPLRPLVLGQVRLAQGRLEEAQALLEPLASEEFQLPYLQIAMGTVYARRGLLAEAEAAFRRAIERDDDNAEAHDFLGTVLRRTGRYEEAVQEHMRSAALQHARPLTHVHLAMALARVGELDWSIRAFEVALELAPNLIFPHRCLTHLYRRVKKDDVKARYHFDRVVELRRKLRAAAQAKAAAS